MYCDVLGCTTTYYDVLRRTTTYFGVLQRTTAYNYVTQRITMYLDALRRVVAGRSVYYHALQRGVLPCVGRTTTRCDV